METAQIHFILTTMSNVNPELPTSFEMVNASCARMEQEGTRNFRGSRIVNTDGGKGQHYNCLIYSFNEEGVFRALYLEPLKSIRISKHMSETLRKGFKKSIIDHKPIGFQTDGWSCGYISIWLQLWAEHLVSMGQSLYELPPPKCPEGWMDVCLRLLTTHNLLDQLKNNDIHPRFIGLRRFMMERLMNGRFESEVIMEQINDFEKFTC